MLHVFLDDRPWFKPKLYGIGAFPATWQGWALTLAYGGLMVGMGLWQDRQGGEADAGWWTIVSIATLVFIVIAWKKTQGGWRWRWGGKAEETHQSGRRPTRKTRRGPRA